MPAFCQREGIAESTFYGWRARLRGGRRQAETAVPSTPRDFIPLGVMGVSGVSRLASPARADAAGRLEIKLELGRDGLAPAPGLMFFPEGQVQVYLYASPVDMRRSFDGLYALTRNQMHQDPLSGHLFGFFNRRATMIKVLYFDRTGFCVWAKRLERGRFVFDWNKLVGQTDYTGLKMLLEGIEPRRIRKRYQHRSGAQ